MQSAFRFQFARFDRIAGGVAWQGTGMRQKVIHVGIGVFGKRWCHDFLKANVDDGTIEVVALVDVDPQALAFGRSALGLPEERCYTDPKKAFAEAPADFCTVVVPPDRHEA